MAAGAPADALAFNTELRRRTTVSGCADLFREAIALFGFDTFACGEIDLDDRDRCVFYIIDWPDAWRQFYLTSGLVEHDPVVDALRHRTEPFTWSDLRADRTFPRLGAEGIERAAGYGWVEGLVVPVSRGENKVGLVSLVGHRRGVDPADVAFLCLISVCLHGHVRTLLGKDGFAAPPAGLTARELDCLKLVAKGRSDREIAQALSIAVSTAHEHVENAKRKLNTGSRAETVASAAALGIIDV